MKLRVIAAFLFVICVNASFGQTDTSGKKIITKNQEAKEEAKSSGNNKADTIRDPKKNIKKSNKTFKKSIPTNNGVGLMEGVTLVALDSVKYLKDSITALSKAVFKFEKEIAQLQEENKDLRRQISEQSKKKEVEYERRNWRGWLADKIYSVTKFVLLISVFIILFFIMRRRSSLKKAGRRTVQFFKKVQKTKGIIVPSAVQMKPVIAQAQNPTSKQSIQTSAETIQQSPKAKGSGENNLPKSFSNVYYKQEKKGVKDNWFVVGASSIGKGHVADSKPCQDNHYCVSIKEGWGIAVSCDGAGSAKCSDLGSQFVAERSIAVFKSFLEENKFVDENRLPNSDEWQGMAKLAFLQVYNSLIDYSKEQDLEISSLACTSIVIVFTPIGLLAAHIGDGRAGYCNSQGTWKSLITPHKGEEANQTIFLTSSSWLSEDDLKMSEVLVPETTVIGEKAIAFTLMSDGCESHSFDCSKMDNESGRWIDPNLPAEKFFNPLLKQLKSMYDNKVPLPDVTSSWCKFIEGGTPGLKDETDDKTLILGILI